MSNLNYIITIAKEELEKAELETHLIKIANKWGARFESSFEMCLRLQAKKNFLNFRRYIKEQMEKL